MSDRHPSLEEVLELAAEILEVDTARPDDSWYSLGGDSLTALQLSAIAEESWGLLVDVDQVTDAPSFTALHAVLGTQRPR